MLLDIPPQTIQIIQAVANQQGQSLENYIIISAYEKALGQLANKQPSQQNNQENKEMLLTDFVKTLPRRSYLGDGLAIQQELRNKWD
ncbi:hypothetical protein [Faucicola boevrei]|uniref:hypothetical protein n=1 Tax=Faucicola boevrei TaxID=346665 RepID=UPI0003627734|nr:hypothetical protein [Moraxella boevrei]